MNALYTYSCCVPSRLEKICYIVADVIEYLQHHVEHLDDCTIFEVRVILNELISNAIRHGNEGDETKQVRVKAGVTRRGYAFFVIEDEGSGFCSEERPFCCTGLIDCDDINEVKESGRGILIVNSLCDRVKYNKKGNKVVVLKRIAT